MKSNKIAGSPSGTDEESYIDCKIENMERIVDLWLYMESDMDCINPELRKKVKNVTSSIQELLREFKEIQKELEN